MNFSGTIASDFMKLANIPLRKRPDLVDFAATDFLSLRKSIIKYIKAVYPTEYQYFVEADLGMMFIELVAYMGSIMSMKADMLANENFFATAQQRASVKKLLELIGVRMKGPLSAVADAKIKFETSPEVIATTYNYVLTPAQRVTTIESPEDGGQTTYTLYKVVNGLAEQANSTGNIILYASEADDKDSGAADASSTYTNLALQEGALVVDSGEFAATEGIKTIKLSQSPVVDGSVEVFMNSDSPTTSGAYNEVQNVYFASGSNDKIFQVNYDSDFGATIVFGDGAVGVSPNDTASYLVTYRIGGGSRGNLVDNAISVNVAGTSNGIERPGTMNNTSPVMGGANAETVENAKKWAPLTFARQNRIVTMDDYSVFANSHISKMGTVGKATAAVRKAYCSANMIDVYVLEKASDRQLQKSTPNFKQDLLTAINKEKMMTDEVVVVDGLIRTLDLIVTIYIDREDEANESRIVSQVRGTILDYMNADNRDFGQELRISELNRKIFEIAEVRYSTLDNLDQDISVDFNEIIQLNNLTIRTSLLE
jgi:hypothetical protein